ncbi:MAG: nucleotide exchange factor GrpE [Rivularia sp. (in: cyanobacteria)]|jgi:molecular chaperone GrpE
MNSDSSQPNSNGEVNEQITIEANAADAATVNAEDETNPTTVQSNAGASDSAQLNSLKAQLDERNSQYMRIAADFENYRKRTLKEKDDLELQVKRNTITELLPIIDNFERARAQIKPQNDGEMGIHKSYQGVYKQLVDCLKRLGVSPMRPEGQEFDPNEHEAVMREPTDEYPEGTVLEELVRGYFLGDRVLRHAMVKVAAQKEDTSGEDSQSGEAST